MNKRIQHQQEKNNNNKNYLFIFLFLVLLFLGLGQMYLSNRLAGWGKRLEEIEKQKAQLDEENKRLKISVLSYGNLSSLEEIAVKKGFIEDPQVLNLSPKVPVALNP